MCTFQVYILYDPHEWLLQYIFGVTPQYHPPKHLQEEMLVSLGLDVTVTRRQDATFAANGYIYNVYFDGETQVGILRVCRRLCSRNCCW